MPNFKHCECYATHIHTIYIRMAQNVFGRIYRKWRTRELGSKGWRSEEDLLFTIFFENFYNVHALSFKNSELSLENLEFHLKS